MLEFYQKKNVCLFELLPLQKIEIPKKRKFVHLSGNPGSKLYFLHQSSFISRLSDK